MIKRESIRKAVAGILAFIVGMSIAIATIVPLLIYLNNTSGAMLKALNQVRDFQSQKSSESLEVVYEGGSIYLKNTGTIPATIVLAIIDSGGGCTNNAFLLKTNLTINTGNRIASINTTSNSYGLPIICYVMTARGNVFPVKEKYNAILSQQTGNILFTPNNTIFADDANKYSIDGSYSNGDLSCSTRGRVSNDIVFRSYDPNKKLISVVDNNGNPITITRNSGGCISVTFKDAVSVPQGAYVVVIYYRIIINISSQASGSSPPGGQNMMSVGIIPSLMKNNMIYISSSSNVIFSPSSISGSYLSFEGYSLIPLKGVAPGLYDLNITVVFPSLQGGSGLQVGIEYIAIQGATLVTR